MATDNLRTIKELLEIIKQKVNLMEFQLRGHSSGISRMKDQQSVMNEKLDELSNKIETSEKRVLEEMGKFVNDQLLPQCQVLLF